MTREKQDLLKHLKGNVESASVRLGEDERYYTIYRCVFFTEVNNYIFSEESYNYAKKNFEACLRSAKAYHRIFTAQEEKILHTLFGSR